MKFTHYALIKNSNDTLLKLNPCLKDYEFIKIYADDLRSKYFWMFEIKKPIPTERELKGGKKKWTREDDDNLWKMNTDKYFDDFRIEKDYQIFLRKKTELDIFRKKNSKISQESWTKIRNWDYERWEEPQKIINQLRLLKTCAISVVKAFTFDKEICSYRFRFTNDNPSDLISYVRGIEINDSDVKKFQEWQKLEFKDYHKMCLDLFHTQYYVHMRNPELSFITLISCLESILNCSSNQISHTFSRHLALLNSTSREEFEKKYNEFKNYYNLRSQIIHGSKKCKKLPINEVGDLCRKTIFEWIKSGLSKKQFFNLLNSKGYN